MNIDQVKIELWPSAREVAEGHLLVDAGKVDSYFRELDSFYSSYQILEPKLQAANIGYSLYNGFGRFRGRRGAGAVPPTPIEFLCWLTPAVAVAVYKLLKLWSDGRNGRKFRVRFLDFEFESTKLTKKQFFRAFKELADVVLAIKKDMSDDPDKGRNELRSTLVT